METEAKNENIGKIYVSGEHQLFNYLLSYLYKRQRFSIGEFA